MFDLNTNKTQYKNFVINGGTRFKENYGSRTQGKGIDVRSLSDKDGADSMACKIQTAQLIRSNKLILINLY